MTESLRPLTPVMVVFAVLLGAMWWGFDAFLAHRDHPNRDLRTEAPSGPVVLQANRGGHYVAPGTINGEPVTFLVDTGATAVAIPAGLADRLGLRRGARINVATAAGPATAYRTRIDRLQLGGIQARGVRATINPAMDGSGVLLGMTFLRHLDFRQRDGKLILEPRR